MPSATWNEHTTGEEIAKELQDNIKGKNGASFLIAVRRCFVEMLIIAMFTVLLVGATVNSLGGEFLRNIAPYAKTIWVAGRTISKYAYTPVIETPQD